MTTNQAMTQKDMNRNPNGKGGFGDNPQNRNPGGWDKSDSISYQYNSLMRLSPDEFKDYKPETMAQKIAYKRLKIAVTESGLYDTKEITDRTEGKAPQSIDMTSNGETIGKSVEVVWAKKKK